MKWWDRMPWSSFSECWALSQLFHSPLSLYLLLNPYTEFIIPNYLFLFSSHSLLKHFFIFFMAIWICLHSSVLPILCSLKYWLILSLLFSQSLSHIWLFATPWTAEYQASLSFTITHSLLKLMSIKSEMPSNHLILCHPLLLPSIFPGIRERVSSLHQVAKSIGVSASASVLSMNIQDWFL